MVLNTVLVFSYYSVSDWANAKCLHPLLVEQDRACGCSATHTSGSEDNTLHVALESIGSRRAGDRVVSVKLQAI